MIELIHALFGSFTSIRVLFHFHYNLIYLWAFWFNRNLRAFNLTATEVRLPAYFCLCCFVEGQ